MKIIKYFFGNFKHIYLTHTSPSKNVITFKYQIVIAMFLAIVGLGFFPYVGQCAPSWQDISTNLPELVNLNDVHFVGSEGWITGGNDKIYYTSDEGKVGTFTTLNLPTGSGITSSVFMKSNTDGYAVTFSGDILHGVNNVWTTLYQPGGGLNSVHFPPSSTTGYTCGSNGTIWSFTNSEATDISPPANVSNLKSINFPENNSDGKVCGETTIARYLSGTWSNLQFYDSSLSYNSIFFIDNTHGWACGTFGTIVRTVDGTSWTRKTSNITNNLNDIFFLNSSEGWAVGTEVLLHTVDGGETWVQEAASLTTGKELRAVYFTDTNKGYVIGNDTMLKYSENLPDPITDIKANASDGPVTITPGDPLSLRVTLDSQDFLGEDADWWMLAKTPSGWFHFKNKLGWQPGRSFVFQRALFDLDSQRVPNISNMEIGKYTFYFGVDMVMDGFITKSDAYYDSVEVNVE